MRLRPALPLVLMLAAAACVVERRSYCGGAGLPFSNAFQVGNMLFVAGHLGLDPETGMPPADPAEEARLLLDAFGATLAEADMTMDDLVQVQVHCADIALYDTFNTVYRERFDGPFPARAFLGSGPLLRGCRFEILGTAVRR